MSSEYLFNGLSEYDTPADAPRSVANDPLLKKILLSMRDWGRDCWCESGVTS